MEGHVTNFIIYWLPLILLIGIWIYFIQRTNRGRTDVRDMNASFKKQNEEIISLLRDIKQSLENRNK
jgi:ATP-dependent Zn protease